MLAHVQTIMKADQLAHAVPNALYDTPGSKLIDRHGLELGNPSEVTEGCQFYAHYVETLGNEIVVYKIEKQRQVGLGLNL